ncbi:type I restriction endonuclease subunit R [Nesterenkonia sp. MY13]|uniref:Type I restriction enzyme endonuclease subunit n=1 Tax=Nesterenkonia sedimenti TaxID=1463632 RepID=A0A7X8TJ45_9MICC|nr:type I restriction endonuclease subunit R [Nesterenkonia sedimenti]NLS09702.1 type I restriction endonuclease subunit R [Nesterenkonia sedimenti]
MVAFNEEAVENAALDHLRQLGYQTLHGVDIAPDALNAERESWSDTLLTGRLRAAVARLNPTADAEQQEQAVKRFLRTEHQDLVAENMRRHEFLLDGVPVTYSSDGHQRTKRLKLVDYKDATANDWLAVNQFSIVEHRSRRPDVVVFLNGIPVAVFELKSPSAQSASLKSAWNQIQTYRDDIPSLFTTNAVTVISDWSNARMATFTAGFEHYAPWKTTDGTEALPGAPSLDVLIRGVFDPPRLLDLISNFIVFSEETTSTESGQAKNITVKRVAKYHQYWAVNKAVDSVVNASSPEGDKRGGVVWHTQGSGKSLEMLFFAGKIMRDDRMGNPTLVFLTDRQDLDNQLFEEVFAPASILAETPVQAETREDLREKLRRASGGIIFTTLQKFGGEVEGDRLLTDRRNVVVIADEAHRSQYGLDVTLTAAGELRGGLAKYMRDALPNATYLGFTGTPIESTDKSTKAVFGDYIDVYDLSRAVADEATVKIFYESRLAKIALDKTDLEALDELAESAVGESEEATAQKAKSKWARLEKVVGSQSRLELVAEDIVSHWEARRAEMTGKAMIVTMSRRIAVDLYSKIIALRPEWHSDEVAEGSIKVVMTGSASDPPEFRPHLYDARQRNQLKARAKNPTDPLELVIVRDMWLTGFDSPAMHTMYVDKTMQGAGLMQAIARVNRRYKDKTGGLIVDYIGIFTKLQDALAEYSPSDRETTGVPIEEMVALMQEKHQIISSMLHGVDYRVTGEMTDAQRVGVYQHVMDHVLAQGAADTSEGKNYTDRFLDHVLALVKAFALCGASEEAAAIRDDVALFTAVRTAILKMRAPGSGESETAGVEADTAISQIVNQAITADRVIDVYGFEGREKPELSLLSEEFLDRLAAQKDKEHIHLAMLRKLLNDEIKTVRRTNVVKGRKFSEMLDAAVKKYTNQALTAAEVMAELVKVAKEMKSEQERAEQLNLTLGELAFFDALAQNGTAVTEMGDQKLRDITVDLVQSVQNSVTIDWDNRESVKAGMRSKLRRLLAIHGYPPDHQEEAIELVLVQAQRTADNIGEAL